MKQSTQQIFAGIDVGSATTKTVLLNPRCEVLASVVIGTGGRIVAAAEHCFLQAAARAGIAPTAVAQVIATGYGRKRVSFAHGDVTEITCHAKGTHHLHPEVNTVVDVGGQDSKVIRLGPSGKAINFLMNDKCAAGTGRFLEVMARVLELDLEEMSQQYVNVGDGIAISSICTVFAESEVVSLIAEGRSISEIVSGIHAAIAVKTIGLLGRLGRVDGMPVALVGGVAKNQGFVAQMRHRLGGPVLVPSNPQNVGALGAALIARERTMAAKPDSPGR
jgi:predicted CoA-substrate-specific enzyme activase